MPSEITVFAPATVANLSCGYDIFALAIDKPGDEIHLKKRRDSKIQITKITGDKGKLPSKLMKNTVGIAVVSFLKHINSSQGVDIEIHKKMPIGSGLGSSAASAVAGAFAINELLDRPMKKRELLPFALEAEMTLTGMCADNVSASLLGGFILVRSYEPLDIVELPVPKELFCALVYPHVEVLTKMARALLPNKIALQKVVQQSGNVAGLVAGLHQENYDLISRSLQDVIVEPERSKLIPGFQDIKSASLNAGALGCGISGSGPSVFSFTNSKDLAEKVGLAKVKVLDGLKVNCNLFISKVNMDGVVVLD